MQSMQQAVICTVTVKKQRVKEEVLYNMDALEGGFFRSYCGWAGLNPMIILNRTNFNIFIHTPVFVCWSTEREDEKTLLTVLLHFSMWMHID